MDQLSYLSNAETAYIDSLYEAYTADPLSVDESWRRFFEGFTLANTDYGRKLKPAALVGSGSNVSPEKLSKEIGVLNLIAAYRSRGHLFAKIDPLNMRQTPTRTLVPEEFGLGDADLDTVFVAGEQIGIGPAPLRQIIGHLNDTYCSTVGAEYRYIRNPEIISWLEKRMESTRNRPSYTENEKQQILTLLHRAAAFEEYLQRRMPGQKRFSLEGAEALIPSMNALIMKACELGVSECVIGMAHRGRLNVLTNVLRKEYDWVFSEFIGKYLANEEFDGDVKYHLGYSNDRTYGDKSIHLSLCPNPSHLDAVNPVVVGISRAKMDLLYGGDNNRICPILIHGDASLAGQGIGYEVIQMSRLKGYEVGGTVHLVINNQIGFTTDSIDSRSSTYCTDLAKVTLSPVFHVNGDDVEAVIYTTMLAMEFRQVFKRDVFINIVCYRRYGHNEGDEPRFTQPAMYARIDQHPRPYEVYKQKTLEEGIVKAAFIEELERKTKAKLDSEWEQSKDNNWSYGAPPARVWSGIEFYDDDHLEPNPNTGVSQETLLHLTERMTHIPEGFTPHRNVQKAIQQRAEMVANNRIDWGTAEHLAFASLLNEGYAVRISGQDAERGTFAHRHAVIHDVITGEKRNQLHHLSGNQAPFYIYNSHLSEYAVMGFELGYSMARPKALTIWEAQYGDFVNGAQIIIDQFLTASKTKWQRMSGLVLLLPHGYEGGGPEHSSARIERFLTLAAENNMYVCNITSPANFFHALRRQVVSKTRRPLVVFSPKWMLRWREAVSPLVDFTTGTFQEVYDDTSANPKKIKRVVFTFGKLYYELLERRTKENIEDIALVRIEQLYPFPEAQLAEIVNKYSKAKEFVWAQEEPENMGGWSFFLRKFKLKPVTVIARKESASPAVGASTMHAKEQEQLLVRTLNLVTEPVTA
jgi:2-oxoglutarate dehydrogenase E1 component